MFNQISHGKYLELMLINAIHPVNIPTKVLLWLAMLTLYKLFSDSLPNWCKI